MQKKIQLHIDNPCSEDWTRMHPEEQGRFCSSCQTTVVDFTTMSEQEILTWFAKPKDQGSTCGRFLAGQLNRDMIPRPEQKKSPRWIWHYLLTGMLITSEASAQTQPNLPPVSQIDSAGNDHVTLGKISAPQLHHPPDILRGRLVDADSKQPLANASIMTGRDHGCRSDEDGYFTIPRKALTKTHSIIISSIGYEPTVIDVSKTWKDDQIKVIPINMTKALMGDTVVIAGRVNPYKTKNLLKDTLAFLGLTKDPLTVFPNPAARGSSVTLSARLDKPGSYTVELFTSAGAFVQQQKIEGPEKSKRVTMDIPANLPPGTYLVRLSHPAMKKACTQQLVIF